LIVVGPDRAKHIRNAGIVILLALIVWLVPGGDRAGATISSLLGIVFAAGLLFLGYRVYMENRETIFGLEDRQRGILYGSAALGAITLVATSRLWNTGAGGFVWMILIGLSAYGLYFVWRAYRTY
jgi:TRAP-type C4-dicarboxylate transport system permease small subunit